MNSSFWPHSVFMCSLWISEKKSGLFPYTKLTIFRRVLKISKSNNFVMSVRPNGTTLLLLDGFSWHFILKYFLKTCRDNSDLINTLRTGDADLRFYIKTVQDGWNKSAFLTRASFPCTIHLIMQYIEPVSEWSCWRMYIETWPHSELNFRHRASSI